jgi:predicted PurR-regulated permease PerM
MPLPEEYRRHSFLLLGAVSLLGGVTLLLLWSAWLLVRPHLMALVWATCAAAVMRSAKAPLTSFLLRLNSAVPVRAKQVVRVALFSVYMLLLLHLHDALWLQASLAERVVFISVALTIALVALLPWIVSTDTLATLSILAAVVACIAFFAVFVVRVCYAESVIAVRLVRAFLDDYIEHARGLVVTQAGSPDADVVWRNAFAACDQLPMHIPVLSHYWLAATPPAECHAFLASARAKAPEYAAQIATWLASNVQWIGDKLIGGLKGIVDVVGSVGDLLFSGFIFISALYYFVKNDRAIAAELRALSPLDAAENGQILTLLHEKVLKTFILSVLLAMSRFLIALGCFSYAGFEVIWVFSFASGFLAIVPILSSWLIWLPATIVLVARDGVWSTPWAVMVGAHLLAYSIDYLLYKLVGIDSQRPEIIGMAFVMGVYTFGAYGVLVGPLVSGALLALVDIYKVYLPKQDPVALSAADSSHELAVSNGIGRVAHDLASSFADSILSPTISRRKRTPEEVRQRTRSVPFLFALNDDDSDDSDDHRTSGSRLVEAAVQSDRMRQRRKGRGGGGKKQKNRSEFGSDDGEKDD